MYSFEKTKSFCAYEKIDEFLSFFKQKINDTKSREKDKNDIYNMCIDFISNSFCFAKKLMDDENDMDTTFALKTACDHICTSLKKSTLQHKRDKQTEENVQYVAPILKAIGTRWEMKVAPNTSTKYAERIQNTMQYIPITETIRKLFSRQDFRKEYFKHNMGKEGLDAHICESNVYRNFCCGRVFKNTELFRLHPESLQIQIASDDFNITNPLQSHASVYKITPVYFSIKNMPSRFLSKTDNIFLAAICFSDDLKSKETDFNNIWKLIVNDIKYLETIGIDIAEDLNIKGTITSCCFDNLGAHTSLGFVESFRAAYYCIVCEMPSVECSHATKANPTYKRTMESYNKQLNIVAESTEVNFTETKGVKRYCLLNDINNFHILKNHNFDIMHDCAEGSIFFVLKELFEYCFQNNIFKEKELASRIKEFNYGMLSQSNHPSIIIMKKKNLNQNASQAKCLFEKIPFILWEYQNNIKLKEAWECMESLMRIIQCVYSSEITETDIQNLESDIESHLTSYQKIFKKKLRPKQHNLLHYPDIIRDMGPLVHYSMIRYEAKHQSFKQFVTSNFKNITSTFAKKHQQRLTTITNSFEDDITHGILFDINNAADKEKNMVLDHFRNVDNIKITKWVLYHSYKFQNNVYIIHDSKIFEIILVFLADHDFYFLGIEYEFLQLHKFSNSLEIQRTNPEKYNFISLKKLSNPRPFEAHKVNKNIFVKASTLEFKKICE